ncbi:MAG: response regulator [Candidatus Electrothrix sp. AW1]|nr:response regulator [Candidatus Electrothrix sp. AX1]MCI5181106.1 response regulator [Candidatus Electrothrix gigas]
MKADTERLRTHFSPACLVPLVIMFGLSLAELHSHFLFHALSELFSIIFISSIFLFIWNTRRFQVNPSFLFLGIAYLFIGSVDFVHILISRAGENVFAGSTINASLQLWLAARYLESISLLLASLFFHKKINEYLVFFFYSLLVSLIFYSVFAQFFSVCSCSCSVAEEGATAFKRGSDVVICFFFLLALYFFHKQQENVDRSTLHFLQAAVILAVLSQVTTNFFSEQDNTALNIPLNITGMLAKICSLYCLAKAVFIESFLKPSTLLVEQVRAHKEQLKEEIAKRIKVEKQLLRERTLFDDALDMIHIIDEQQRITSVNPMELTTLGYCKEELIGMPLINILHPTYKKTTTAALEQIFLTGKGIKDHETALLSKDGQQVDVEASAVPQFEQGQIVSVRVIMRNITDQKQKEHKKKDLENQLRHSQKMEAVGTLAGGVAHDFNNILGPIFGYTELALDVLPENDNVTVWLKEVLRASHRARELVRQILTISRRTDQEVQPLRIQLLVKETLKLLRCSIPSNIEIRQSLAPDCQAVLADPTRIYQIVMNLCINGYYAMREKNSGVLEVSLQQVTLTQEDIQHAMPLQRLQCGEHLQLTVRDTGKGIPEELLEKIFDSYFTTKAQGEGTGLGLAVVQSIIFDFGGDITVESELGKGSAFHVYLPVIQGDEDDVVLGEGPPLSRGTERILVVDDDLELLQIHQRVLESLGYQVTVYTDSCEAVAAFQQKTDAFDLVITDMTMPKMSGVEVTKKIIALRPDLPVIICTGFSELIDEDKAQEMGARALLMKPLTKKELACAVRKVLD